MKDAVDDAAGQRVREVRLIDCFTKGTWIALGLALVCLFADTYVAIYIPLHRSVAEGILHHSSAGFVVALRMIEVTLALLALWLLRYAFSSPPRLRGHL